MQATKTIGLVLSLFFFTLSSCKKSSKTLPRKPGSSKQSAASKSPGQQKDSPDQIAKDLAAAAAQAREECEGHGWYHERHYLRVGGHLLSGRS